MAAAVFVSLLLGVVVDTGQSYSSPAVKVASGDLATTIDSFVDEIPRAYTKAYDVPTSLEVETMREAYDAVETGNLAEAAGLADPLGYDVVRYTDTDTGREAVVLSERQNSDGSWDHAWGMYVHSTSGASDTTVEVTHPIADWNTENVGVELFRDANAEDLFIAGAHRYANCDGQDLPCEEHNPDRAADVAHAEQSVFNSIHQAAVEAPTEVAQPHGFSQEGHPDCDEVVVSAGAVPPSPLVQRVHGALLDVGFGALLYDGATCPALGATENEQGKWTRGIPADFVHVETSKPIRDDPARRSLLVAAIADALLPPTITNPRPAPGSSTRDRTPAIKATVKDEHTDLARGRMVLSVDGRRVTTFAYDPATNRLSYAPSRDLALGRHTVRLNVTDSTGNIAVKGWRFKVVR